MLFHTSLRLTDRSARRQNQSAFLMALRVRRGGTGSAAGLCIMAKK
jgi:hypothetical protein